MLNVLWHLRGSVPIGAPSGDQELLDRVQRMTARQGKPETERGEGVVTFNKSPLATFGPNWLALILFDRGTYWIDRTQERAVLRYDFRCLHSFILCAGGGLLFFGVAGGGAKGLAIGGVAFAWLYGMNMLVALVRVPSLVRDCVV